MLISYALIAAMIVVGAAPMVYELLRGRFDFFNAKNPFIIYFLLQLAVSGWITLYTGVSSPLTLDLSSHLEAYQKALAVSLLGLACFQVGYYTQAAHPMRMATLFRSPWRGNRSTLVAGGLVVVGYAAFALLMEVNGGLSNFLLNREAFRAGGLSGQGVLMFPATTLLCLAPLIYLLGRAPAPSKGVLLKSIVLMGIALLPAMVLGFRSAIFLPVLQFMVVMNYTVRKLRILKLGAGLLVIVTAFTVYGLIREVPPGVPVDAETVLNVVRERPDLAYMVVSRSKGTEVVATVVHKLDRTHDYQSPWSGLLEAATILVPRSLWNGKPEPLSERFTTYFFGRQLDAVRGHYQEFWGGVSPTIVGESYWYLGSLGVALALYLFGRVVRIAYCTVLAYRWSRSVVAGYAVVYASFAMFAEAVQGYANGLVMSGVALTGLALVLTARMRPMHRSAEVTS